MKVCMITVSDYIVDLIKLVFHYNKKALVMLLLRDVWKD